MIKNFTTNTLRKHLFSAKNTHEIKMLKWLIIYQNYPEERDSDFFSSLRKDMIESCNSLRIANFKDISALKDIDYIKYIHKYTLEEIGQSIHKKKASPPKILLYVYIILTTNPENYNGDSDLNTVIREERELIELFPQRNPSDTSNGNSGNDPIEIFIESVIMILYLWLADMGTLSEYNVRVGETSHIDAGITYESAKKFWNKCKPKASRYSYQHHKKNPNSRVSAAMEANFSKKITFINEIQFLFAPSLLTLAINDMEPNRNKKKDSNIFSFPRQLLPKYIPESVSENIKYPDSKRTSDFLKMIILPTLYSYNSREKYGIEARFQQEIKKNVKRAKFDDITKEYMSILTPENNIIFSALYATSNCTPIFSFDYFDIFLYTYRNQNLLTENDGMSMDFAFSLLHLNIITRWYDALLLLEGMPFEFLKYNYLYLKLLTIPYATFDNEKMLKIIKCLLKITIKDFQQILQSKNQAINIRDMLSLFYKKTDLVSGMSNILDNSKNRLKRANIPGVNPVYKYIYLLDNPNICWKCMDKLLYDDYLNYIQEHDDLYPYRNWNRWEASPKEDLEYEEGYN